MLAAKPGDDLLTFSVAVQPKRLVAEEMKQILLIIQALIALPAGEHRCALRNAFDFFSLISLLVSNSYFSRLGVKHSLYPPTGRQQSIRVALGDNHAFDAKGTVLQDVVNIGGTILVRSLWLCILTSTLPTPSMVSRK